MVADQSIVITHLTAASVAVAAIQWLKNSPYLPWITKDKKNLLRVVALLASGLGAVGIHYTWNPESRLLSFEIPTFAAAVGFGVAWFKSFVVQEVVYRGTTKNGVRELLVEILENVKARPLKTQPQPEEGGVR